MIELRGIKKRYQMGATEFWALNGITLSVNQGEFIALKGPSGSGKTTLLNIIGLLDMLTEGQYLFDGKDVTKEDQKSRSKLRAQYLGFVFQTFNLIPELNVFENVEIPLLISGEKPEKRRDAVLRIIEEVGLSRHMKHRPSELSGGQMQRVAIARALVKNPPLIIADEPTANLDSKTGTEIVSLMKHLNQTRQITFIFATHDETIIPFMDKIVTITDGVVQ